MRYLLDTHTLLWFFENNPSLSPEAKANILDKNNVIYVSIASFWEIAIKISLGKLNISFSTDELFEKIEDEDFILMAISSEHIKTIQTLTHHHRDPFDRILISQAKVESCTVITRDEAFTNYPITVLW